MGPSPMPTAAGYKIAWNLEPRQSALSDHTRAWNPCPTTTTTRCHGGPLPNRPGPQPLALPMYDDVPGDLSMPLVSRRCPSAPSRDVQVRPWGSPPTWSVRCPPGSIECPLPMTRSLLIALVPLCYPSMCNICPAISQVFHCPRGAPTGSLSWWQRLGNSRPPRRTGRP